MQTRTTTWPLAEKLRRALTASPLSNGELAERAGVSYYAVRRMRLEGVRNRSQNAIALCTFFDLKDEVSAPAVSLQEILDEIAGAWDGTNEHGRLILDLVRTVSEYSVKQKG